MSSYGKTHFLFLISFYLLAIQKAIMQTFYCLCFLIRSWNSWRGMKICIHTRNIWNHHCALGHRTSFFSPLSAYTWLPLSCSLWQSREVLPSPSQMGNLNIKKLKINTELLFALSFLQDMLCHARIPHQLQFGTPTTHISVSPFLPHGCQLAISPSAALLKITGMALLFSSVPSKVFEASFYASEYWVWGFGFCLLLFWRGWL